MKKTTHFPRRVGTLAAAVALSLAGANALAAGAGPWDFSANIGAVSNYMWRGVTQSDNQPAVQGGLDVAHESGFYAGTWASNVDFGAGNANYELDVYAGFDFSLPDENASLGLNTTYYAYPDQPGDSIDFWEIGLSGGYDFGAAAVSAGVQYTVWGGKANDNALWDDGDLYYSASLDIPLPYDFSFGVFGGYYDFKNSTVPYTDPVGVNKTASADYWHWGASISKDAGEFGTFSFTYEQIDGDRAYDGTEWVNLWNADSGDAKVWVGWSKTF